MPPRFSPSITNFGDESHDTGESGLTIDGVGFGPFAGAVWMYANSDRTGASDQLTQTGWNDMQITGVSIPGSPSNSTGTVYLFVQRTDLAWSFPYEFTLTSPAGQSITPATESDEAVALSGTFHAVLQAATETDSSVALGQTLSLAQGVTSATESDSAVTLVQGTTTQSISVTAATELDSAIGLTSPQTTTQLVTGGVGRKGRKRGRRYPRRVMIGGRVYIARSAEHERELLREFIDASVVEAKKESLLESAPRRKKIRLAKSRLATLDAAVKAAKRQEEELMLILVS